MRSVKVAHYQDLSRLRPRLAERYPRRPQHQILPARPGQKPRQQAGYAVEQDLLLRTKSIFAAALDIQEAKLASAHPHCDHNFFARPEHRHLIGLDESFLQQRRRRFLVQRQINSHPAMVPPLAQQPGNLFERRVMKRRPILSQQFFDVGKQVARGAVSFQGAPEGNWRSESSLMRWGMGVNAWHYGQHISKIEIVDSYRRRRNYSLNSRRRTRLFSTRSSSSAQNSSISPFAKRTPIIGSPGYDCPQPQLYSKCSTVPSRPSSRRKAVSSVSWHIRTA